MRTKAHTQTIASRALNISKIFPAPLFKGSVAATAPWQGTSQTRNPTTQTLCNHGPIRTRSWQKPAAKEQTAATSARGTFPTYVSPWLNLHSSAQWQQENHDNAVLREAEKLQVFQSSNVNMQFPMRPALQLSKADCWIHCQSARPDLSPNTDALMRTCGEYHEASNTPIQIDRKLAS